MSAEQRLVIEHACARLALEYARAIDFRDYDNFVELFAADAVLDVDVPLHGRAAILEWVMRRPDEVRSRHVITNILIEPQSSDHARGTAYLTLYVHRGPESLTRAPIAFGGAAAVGHYEDRYRRVGTTWLFERRKQFLAFGDEVLPPGSP